TPQRRETADDRETGKTACRAAARHRPRAPTPAAGGAPWRQKSPRGTVFHRASASSATAWAAVPSPAENPNGHVRSGTSGAVIQNRPRKLRYADGSDGQPWRNSGAR